MRAVPVGFAMLVLLSLVAAMPARAVVFDDGTIHVVNADNSFPFEPVTIDDAPSGAATTLIVEEGGLIGGRVDSFGTSLVRVQGGQLDELLTANEMTTLRISGGSLMEVFVRGQSIAEIAGGQMDVVLSQDTASLTISGGSQVTLLPRSSSPMIVKGGLVTRNIRAQE